MAFEITPFELTLSEPWRRKHINRGWIGAGPWIAGFLAFITVFLVVVSRDGTVLTAVTLALLFATIFWVLLSALRRESLYRRRGHYAFIHRKLASIVDGQKVYDPETMPPLEEIVDRRKRYYQYLNWTGQTTGPLEEADPVGSLENA